jgi:TetR/AcrR family transcriptional regulator, cholesterol catabolism regulator
MPNTSRKRLSEGFSARDPRYLGDKFAPATNKRSDTSQRLLAAAIDMFGQKGFESTTMRDLARAVGIKAPAIYNHYRSKEEILAAALIWVMEDFNQQMFGRDDPNASPVERLKGILERYVLHQLDKPDLNEGFSVLLRSSALLRVQRQDAQDEVMRLLRVFNKVMTAIVKAIIKDLGDEAPPLTPSVHAITTMYDQIHRWYRPDGSITPQELIDTYWRFTTSILGISRRNSNRR